MAHDFPEITGYGSALRFALEAEQACADFAAAAGTLRGTPYLGVLDTEPAIDWPEVAEQLAQAEEDAARHHEEFAMQCADELELDARLFGKTAQQNRAAAAEIRELLS